MVRAVGVDVKVQIMRRAKFAQTFENKLQNSQENDFNREAYNDHYKGELSDIQQKHTLKLREDDFSFKDGLLIKVTKMLPLHTNHRLFYEPILLLNPKRAIEVGCGGGII